MYLPAYSPDLNRIEKGWAWIKSRVRKRLGKFYNLRKAVNLVLKQASSQLNWRWLYHYYRL